MSTVGFLSSRSPEESAVDGAAFKKPPGRYAERLCHWKGGVAFSRTGDAVS
jgi:hypothetical protein